MNLLDLTVTYRPVVGFGPDCATCGLYTLRYGPTVHMPPGAPEKGMPRAMYEGRTCKGHAIRITD